MSLSSYRKKRDFEETPEPGAEAVPLNAEGEARFVVQQHAATRLHWDLRLEHDGVLASWAVPNGIPPDPADNRLAVRTEDHPLEYLEFHGEIPKGQYGAGTMTIWDAGTFELHKWDARKVEVTFHGERLHGRYGLFVIGRDEATKQGLDDPPDGPARRPGAGADARARGADDGAAGRHAPAARARMVLRGQVGRRARDRLRAARPPATGEPQPQRDHRRLSRGPRASSPTSECTRPCSTARSSPSTSNGRPSFERLQSRMHVTSPNAVRRLMGSTPVVYAIFDLLYLDGHSLMDLPYTERRERLERARVGRTGLARAQRASATPASACWRRPASQGLEGVVAKRLDSHYEPGRRTGAWLKIKHIRRQELVIGGWIPGEGRRARRIGALLMGYHRDGTFVYAGRVGTGFTEKTLDELHGKLEPLRRETSPFGSAPKLPREAVFVEPSLVAEIEFREWTNEGVLRAPSFKGLREDKSPREVVLEGSGPGRRPRASTRARRRRCSTRSRSFPTARWRC